MRTGSPAYCSETLPWHEDSWKAGEDDTPFTTAVYRYYTTVYEHLTQGKPLVVTPQQVRLQIAVAQEPPADPLPEREDCPPCIELGFSARRTPTPWPFPGFLTGWSPIRPSYIRILRSSPSAAPTLKESQKVAKAWRDRLVAERPEDMLGRVDAVMVTARNGAFHLPYARTLYRSGPSRVYR